jgi:DNA-binding FadR family transcriptional regulator
MIALEIAGLVEVRSGSGVYVVGGPSPARLAGAGAVSSEIGPFDIFAARLAVEGEIAAAAAENATPEDLAEMTGAIEQMRLAVQAGNSTKPANQHFHVALAVASKNPMLLKIVRLIWAEVPKRGPIWAKLDARRQMRPTRIAEHELIVRAIAERNPDHARAAARAHLQAATKDYLEDSAADPSDTDIRDAQEADR